MKICFLFPGQGSQYVGMGEDLLKNFPTMSIVLEEISDTLGYDIGNIMWRQSKDLLDRTDNAQVSIFALSSAIYSIVLQEFPDLKNMVYFLGHSLGEYSALYASSIISLRDAASLVHRRGQLMLSCSQKHDNQVMVALLGSNVKDAYRFIDENCQDQMYVANDNSYSQVVISGSSDSWLSHKDKIGKYGFRKAVVLPVTGAFHTVFMEDASRHLSCYIDETVLDFSLYFISSVVARNLENSHEIRSVLKSQISKPVLWKDSVNFLLKRNIDCFIELGPKNVLSRLSSSIAYNYDKKKKYSFFTTNDTNDVVSLLTFLEGILSHVDDN